MTVVFVFSATHISLVSETTTPQEINKRHPRLNFNAMEVFKNLSGYFEK